MTYSLRFSTQGNSSRTHRLSRWRKALAQSYNDLEIYQLARTLAVEIHKMTVDELPKFEMYEEGSQIRRSSKSVGANIVEGFGRKRYKGEYLRFLTYALASCSETQYHLEVLAATGSLNDGKSRGLLERYRELGRKIYSFRKSVTGD